MVVVRLYISKIFANRMMNDGSLSLSLLYFSLFYSVDNWVSRDKFAALDWYRLSSSNKNWEINVLSNVLGYVLSFNDWTAALILFTICIPDLFLFRSVWQWRLRRTVQLHLLSERWVWWNTFLSTMQINSPDMEVSCQEEVKDISSLLITNNSRRYCKPEVTEKLRPNIDRHWPSKTGLLKNGHLISEDSDTVWKKGERTLNWIAFSITTLWIASVGRWICVC